MTSDCCVSMHAIATLSTLELPQQHRDRVHGYECAHLTLNGHGLLETGSTSAPTRIN